VFVDRDDLASTAIHTHSSEQSGDNASLPDNGVGVGAALHPEAVSAAGDQIGVECLLALVDVDPPSLPAVSEP